jgi:hypothetical protein
VSSTSSLSCYVGNFTKRCLYTYNESNGLWELTSSDNQRTIACSLTFKCAGNNQVYQIHQFDTKEQRDHFVCPSNAIGDPPCELLSESSSSFGESSSSSESAPPGPTDTCPGETTNPKVKVTLTFSGGGTKNFLEETWNSGDQKLICPNSLYGVDTSGAPGGTNNERWKASGNGTIYLHVKQSRFANTPTITTTASNKAYMSIRGTPSAFGGDVVMQHLDYPLRQYKSPTTVLPQAAFTINHGQSSINYLSTHSPAHAAFETLAGAAGVTGTIFDGMFGQLTTTSGITLKWERYAGSGGNNCWKNTAC